MIYTNEKASSQKKINNRKTNDKTKLINENNQIVYNDRYNDTRFNHQL